MNLPSSLALPQSNLLRSRVGILILVAAALLIGGVAYFVLRAPAPAKLPTPATSPAAQALPRGNVTAPPTAAKQVVLGPPAPAWVKRDPAMVAKAAPVAPPSATAAAPAGTGANPLVATAGVAGPAPAGPAAPPAGVPAPAVPGAAPNVATPAAGATAASVAAAAGAAAATKANVVPGAPAAAVPLPGTVAGTAVVAGETPKVLDANTLFQREQYVYQAAGRRDPFQSLIDGRFESQSGDGNLVDVGDIHLVGIMWGSSDKFALVEDSRGRGFVLRVGDPVVNGYISGISKTELQVVQNAFGDSQTVTIQLKSKEGDPNATRNQ
jgi:hypothetical protein